MSLIYNATFDSQTRILSLMDKAGNVISSCEVPSKELVDDITKPLTFKATKDGSIVSLWKHKQANGDFQTSRDGGNTWEDYTIGNQITLNTGDEVSFRVRANRSPYQYAMAPCKFEIRRGKIEAWHNVMSMYRKDDFATYDTAVGSVFAYLFENCTSLTKAPVLPATTLADSCYTYMFSGCQSLTKAPELPATTIAINCYKYMFSGCQSLTKAPELPATTLEIYCYSSMFSGCQSLTKAPALPATTLEQSCYYGMFSGCQSLTKAPELPATTLANSCYKYMFSGCQSLTKAPELPATTLSEDCYTNMFDGCRSLTKAPELPATTLAKNCYRLMFSGCSKLKEVRASATTTAQNALVDWLSGVSATGDFYCDPNATIFPTGTSGIPENWRRLNINEEAPAVDDITKPLTFKATQDGSTVKLTKKGSPSGDFQTSRDGGNTWTDYTIDTAIALNTGEEVSFRAKADRTSEQDNTRYFYFVMTGKIEAWHNVMSMIRTNDFATYNYVMRNAFYHLFEGCTSLTKAPVLPATELESFCYYYMFYGCQSLTKAPELPATRLASYCYFRMFAGCRSLKEVRVSATTTAEGALGNWLDGVSATGDFYCDPNSTIFPSGVSGIPSGWRKLNINDYPT